ncbi:MAG: prepilin peptidase [Patescibacteria group bacterium]
MFFLAVLFLFGSAIGSFLNVVSLRYQPGQKLLDLKIIGGRSACPHCRKTLKWYELIPLLSFLIQKGRCRSCGNRLSFQYPLVELLSGLIFVFVPFALYNLFVIRNSYFIIQVFLWLLVFLLFLLLSIIDFRHYIIPDSINLSLAILGIILIIMSNVISYSSFLGHYALLFDFWPLSLVDGRWLLVIGHFSAAVIAMAFFAAIIILTRGRGMGWGDFKLVGALGLIFGWPDIMAIVFLAFIIGAIAVAPLLLKKQKTMKDIVPFGPFLIIGASLVFFFGYEIINGYFKLFNIYL